ncbi:MAG: hypothetical protein II470_02275 [Selenomonas sp.]|nr:hypothetical protein [Selenomonas sp.]MBQ4211579.1 hypothetical protein [Selenomonas sp.]
MSNIRWHINFYQSRHGANMRIFYSMSKEEILKFLGIDEYNESYFRELEGRWRPREEEYGAHHTIEFIADREEGVVFLGDMTPENEEKYGDGAILQERFQHMLEDYKKEYVKDIPKYRKLIKDCTGAWICNKKDKVAEILGILKKCEKDMDAETQLEYWELQASLKEQS